MADPEVRPFAPLYQPTQQNIVAPGAATTQSQQGQLFPGVNTVVVSNTATATAVLPGMSQGLNAQAQFYVANKTAVWVHVNFGVFGAVRAALITDVGVPPGAVMVFTVNPECSGASIYADGTVGAAPADKVAIHRGVGT